MKTTLLATPITRESATRLLREASRIGHADAKEVGAALARDLETGVRKVLSDCVMSQEGRVKEKANVELELLELAPEPLPEAPAPPPPAPAPAPPPPRTKRSRVRAAVRLVTQVEARARARGFEVDQSPARVDHAIALSLRGRFFCTVSALAGDVYVDGVGPTPLQRVPLAWDEAAEIHFGTEDPANPDPVGAIEIEIALILRAALALRNAESDPSTAAC